MLDLRALRADIDAGRTAAVADRFTGMDEATRRAARADVIALRPTGEGWAIPLMVTAAYQLARLAVEGGRVAMTARLNAQTAPQSDVIRVLLARDLPYLHEVILGTLASPRPGRRESWWGTDTPFVVAENLRAERGLDRPDSATYVIRLLATIPPPPLAYAQAHPDFVPLLHHICEATDLDAVWLVDDDFEREPGGWIGVIDLATRSGALDRGATLDGVLAALTTATDVLQRLDWRAALLRRLDPEPAEIAARAELFVSLLSNRSAAAATFAAEALQRATAAGLLPPGARARIADMLLDRGEVGRGKEGLRLLTAAAAAGDDPNELALVAANAFSHPKRSVQEAAVQTVRKLLPKVTAETRAEIAARVPDLDEPLRPGAADLAPGEDTTEPDAPTVADLAPVPPMPPRVASIAELIEVERTQSYPSDHEIERETDARCTFLPAHARELRAAAGERSEWLAGIVFNRGFGRWTGIRRDEAANAPTLAYPDSWPGLVNPDRVLHDLHEAARGRRRFGEADRVQTLLRWPLGRFADMVDPVARVGSRDASWLAGQLAQGPLGQVEVRLAMGTSRYGSGEPRPWAECDWQPLARLGGKHGRWFAGLDRRPHGWRGGPALVLPTHRDAVAAHFANEVHHADAALTPPLEILVHQEGPAGAGVALAIAFAATGKEADVRAEAVDTLIAFATTGGLHPQTAGNTFSWLIANVEHTKLNRWADVLTEVVRSSRTGAGFTFWLLHSLLSNALHRPDTSELVARAGFADLLRVAADAAFAVNASAPIPGLETITDRGGSSKLVKEAKRLQSTTLR